MANLKEIRDRIVSVKNTRKITEAMRLVAAAKVRRAQDQVLKSRPCLLYTSPSPRDRQKSRMPSSA